MQALLSLLGRRRPESAPLLGSGSKLQTGVVASGNQGSISDGARAAYQAKDVDASRALHEKKLGHAPEHHGGGTICGYEAGDYIKSIVFGGLDGIITTFAIVASVAGANLPLQVMVLTGFAKLLGDGLAMGFGDCMSEGAEQAHIRGERKREAWEMANYPEGEISEMIEIYKEKGFTYEEASRIMFLMTKRPETLEYFVDHMLVQELGHMLPDEDDSPAKMGAVTFASFMFFGSLPLWPYVFFLAFKWNSQWVQFGICVAITVACLFLLGAMQAQIVRQSLVKQGTLMAFNGSLAAGASFLVGWGLQQAVNVNLCG